MQVMFLDSLFYSEQLLCFNYFNTTYGIKDIDFTGSRTITGQPNRRGTDPCSVCWRGVVDLRATYHGSLYCSDQV